MALFPQAIVRAGKSLFSTAKAFSLPGLTALKSLLSKPALANVPLDLERIDCSADAQVATQLLVDVTGNRQIINDNIAPGPRTWQIRGTIFPVDLGLTGQSLLIAQGISSMINGSPTTVQRVLEEILWDAFTNKKQVVWRDSNGKIWDPVAIERLTIVSDPAVQNRTIVEATIKEIRIQSNVSAIIEKYLPSGVQNRAAKASGFGVSQVSKTLSSPLRLN